MKKTLAIVLLSFTLIATISFGVLAVPATSAPVGYHPVKVSQPVTQTPQMATQPQTPANSNNQKMNSPIVNNNGPHPSKLATFKKFFHDKILPRVQLGWEHLKNLKIWHHASNNITKK